MNALTPMEGLFDQIAGLPVHPLVVHFAVVLLPLSAAGLIVLVLVSRWRAAFAGITVLGLAAGTAAAFVAKESGEQLAERVGLPATHATWGQFVWPVALATTVVAAVWYFLQRRKGGAPASTRVVGAIAAILAATTTGLTALTGHTGAEAVWLTPSSSATAATTAAATASTSTSATAATSTSATSSSSTAFTLDQVKTHASTSSCWAAISGKVYDLTAWISAHPGGQDKIIPLCGTDATAAFTAQHSGDAQPAERLATFQIGTLAG